MLTLNTIIAHPGATKQRKRLGRGAGSGHGQTAGKGGKGQTARTGGHVRLGFEGGQTPLYRRVPKRGFKNPSRRLTAVVNVADLEKWGVTDVSLESLLEAGRIKGAYERLAVLGNGDLSKSLQVRAHKVSETAREKVTRAGGQVELVPVRKYIREKKKK